MNSSCSFLPRNFTALGRLGLLLGLLLPAAASAAIPPAEKLLPPDTLLVVSTPDWTKLRATFENSPQQQLWNDPALKPFREKFTTKWREEVVQPLERELGVSLADYGTLLQGQLTLAVLQAGWLGRPADSEPAVVMLLDAREKSDLLRTNLAALRKKWSAAGKPMQTEKIRDVEFTRVPLGTNEIPAALRQIFPQGQTVEELGQESKPARHSELYIGQTDSLLVVSSTAKVVEKILVRLGGPSTETLGEQAEFQAGRAAVFRESPFYAWLNTRVLMELATKALANSNNSEAPSPLPLPDPAKLLSASGLSGLKSVSLGYRDTGAGTLAEIFLSAPETSRTGLMKLLALESKEVTPPRFVPADAVKFSRTRLDGQKALASLEKMVTDFSPNALSTWNFLLDNANEAARLDDPNYDVRKDLFGNLGDDLITYEKAPPGTSLSVLAAPPALYLVGSPNPEKLAVSLKGLLAILSPEAANPKTREFLGRKIYSLGLPGPLAGGSERKLHYVASAGYVAFSVDDRLIEEFLRSAESPAKSLREVTGLSEAIEKIGGGSQGWLGYENETANARLWFDLLTRSSNPTNRSDFNEVLASMIPFAPPEKQIKAWLDFTLLPDFDQVAKYFGFNLTAGSTSSAGITLRYFQPTPVELLKK